jgi:protein TonB
MAQTVNVKQKDFNELVFEERNKSYGAYVLRKKYTDNVLIAMVIGLVILGILSAIPFVSSLFGSNETEVVVPVDFSNVPPPPIDEKKEEIIPPPPPPQEAPPQQQAESVEFKAPVVTAEEVTQITTTEEVQASNPGEVTQEGSKDFFSLPSEGDGQGKVVEEEAPKIFTIVEVQPEFTGGMEAMYKFLRENIQYPQRAKDMNIEGKVYLKFVVDQYGNVGQVTKQRGIGGGCDEEAIRVVKKMPRWKPGKQGGRAVPVWFNLPIEFKLN